MDSEADVLAAIGRRMAREGVQHIFAATTKDAVHGFLMYPSDATLFLTEGDYGVEEIAVVASAPIGDADLARQRSVAAFVLARYSARPEAFARSQIAEAEAQHAGVGSWVVKIGAAEAVYTRGEDALTVKLYKPKCD